MAGRKNRLFSDSGKGADAGALFYSLAATATANGLNVEKYLTDLFTGQECRMPWDDTDITQ